MQIRHGLALAVVVAGTIAAGGGLASAKGGSDDGGSHHEDRFRASLSGYAEVPPVSTTGRGDFRAELDGDEIEWRLRYRDMEGGPVVAAHIHFGQRGVAGGVSAFLCSDAPEQAGDECPDGEADLSGTIRASDVVGPTGQGISAGEFDELVRAMRAGVTYVNVHSQTFPNGEIRGQLRKHH